MNEILQAALEYSRQGFSVIPVSRGDKKPLIKWQRYQHERANEEQIKQWWAKWPDANVGIVTGEISGIFVLDCDSDEGERVIQEMGSLPRTAVAKTGKGHHYYFQHPGVPIRNFARKLPGLDLRGDGGYVVAPPSIHTTGVLYEWEAA